MKFARWVGCLAMLLSVAVFMSAAGCGQDGKKGDGEKQAKGKTKDADQKGPKVDDDKKGGKKEVGKEEAGHGWWCSEHGVTEDDCSLCMSAEDAKKKYKDKGDWCKLHDRAKSQCFICEPGLYEKVWEPKYVAKYGKKPPRPPESEFKAKG